MAAMGITMGIVGAFTCVVFARAFEREHDRGVPHADRWVFGALGGVFIFIFLFSASLLEVMT